MVGIAAMRAGTRASGVAAHRNSMARSSMQVMSECGGSGGAAAGHAASVAVPLRMERADSRAAIVI